MILKARSSMKVTNRLTTDFIIMYINIPTDKGTEHYTVEIDRPDMDEDVYCLSIYDLDSDEQTLYSKFNIDSDYGMFNDYELDEREELILAFIANRLELD